jgi:putative transposase
LSCADNRQVTLAESTCRHHLGLDRSDWLDSDPVYHALGPTDAERHLRYSAFLRSAIPEGEWELIRESVQRGQLTGNGRFTKEVAAILRRRIERRGRGRPAKPETTGENGK